MGTFYSNSATLLNAAEMQTALAASKVRLYKQGFVPTPATTEAELVAEEVAFTGYPAGGAAIALWLDPVFSPAGGAMINAPTVQFDMGPAPIVDTDIVGGFWLEDAAGDVRLIGQFAAPVPMEVLGQGFPLNIAIGFPTGQVV